MRGIAIPNAALAAYIPLQTGVYTVLTTNANGCEGMSANFYFAYSTISNTALTGEDVRVYPNPANSIIYLKASMPVNAALHTMDGRKVWQGNMVQQIDVSLLNDGLYLLSITNDDGRLIKMEKIIKN